MELQHLIVKIFAEGDAAAQAPACVNLFHRWVAEQSMPEMLVDVAELLHVPDGPGVIAVGLEADYALDHGGGRALYRRKAATEGSNADRLAQAVKAADRTCGLLEAGLPGLRFSRRELEVTVNDRFLAPNTPETFAACKADLESYFRGLFGHGDFTIAPLKGDARRRFGVGVTSSRPFAAQ